MPNLPLGVLINVYLKFFFKLKTTSNPESVTSQPPYPQSREQGPDLGFRTGRLVLKCVGRPTGTTCVRFQRMNGGGAKGKTVQTTFFPEAPAAYRIEIPVA
jgi:hypothetical protein